MIKHFINLEWKQYFRSSYWQKSIVINILLIFFALYFVGIFLFMGAFLFKIIGKATPDEDPFLVVNNYIFYWFIGDVLMRFFLQKLPVMSVKPLLTLPIKRSTIVNFVLGKSALNFFNFLPLFAIIPFSISLLKNGYASSLVLTWLAAMVMIILIINFLNFIVEAFSAETELSFLPVIALVGVLFGLDYFNILPMRSLVGDGLIYIANNPVFILIPLGILAIVYVYNFKILKEKLFLDSSLKSKVAEVKVADLSWTNRFGDIAPFMQLDLKLIWRNKRTKSMTMLLIIGVLYGLFFYPQPMYREMEFMFAFIGIFSTGFFLINFGQFIPAWDSSYYKMLMSQNIKYEQYLRSKFILMIMSVVILFVLGIPYVYFGWKILIAHFAAAIYNIGVNSHVILWGGSFNRKKIDLDKKAAFNYQGTGAVQWLIGIPLMLVPMGLFALINWLLGFEIAIATLIVLGVSGIILHKKLMRFITQKYLDSKYKMIDAFSQDN
ncbi:MAG: hypothetical protein HRU49_05645 [Winogradskyella sp.]|uniref:DUF5687 family protein n=1 Tax=Winogradskyella sp. TaxID=1883156 RepID=UPI0025F32F87|nr:DUF5687 family protein [Winogradskyella sp.]NRB83239.1 hypothetical protein [Winogradskyella sp.]